MQNYQLTRTAKPRTLYPAPRAHRLTVRPELCAIPDRRCATRGLFADAEQVASHDGHGDLGMVLASSQTRHTSAVIARLPHMTASLRVEILS